MSNYDVKFNETEIPQYNNSERNIGIISSVIKYSGGIIKDEKHARYIILASIIVAIIVSSLILLIYLKDDITEKNIFNSKTAEPDINNMRY